MQRGATRRRREGSDGDQQRRRPRRRLPLIDDVAKGNGAADSDEEEADEMVDDVGFDEQQEGRSEEKYSGVPGQASVSSIKSGLNTLHSATVNRASTCSHPSAVCAVVRCAYQRGSGSLPGSSKRGRTTVLRLFCTRWAQCISAARSATHWAFRSWWAHFAVVAELSRHG